MKLALPTPDTDFSRDVLGRYLCNTFDEVLVKIDPNAAALILPRAAPTF
jgi:hypothetical protein